MVCLSDLSQFFSTKKKHIKISENKSIRSQLGETLKEENLKNITLPSQKPLEN